MLPLATVSLRLTSTLLTKIDHAATACGMTRSDWMRATLLDHLQNAQRDQELKALEKRLQVRLNELQEVLVSYVTAEIDSLTRD